MALPFRHHTSDVEDNARWARFVLRDGDIVISTRSKSGTTWMQMICALLVFQTPDLPAPLPRLSPWLDWLVIPEQELFADLEAQSHRRFVKTHVPLDGVPFDPRVNYIVVARHPLDAAVSLYHQGANIDRAKVAELTGRPVAATSELERPSLRDWLLEWIDAEPEPYDELDSLPGHFHHLNDAWSRRAEPNVILVRFEDLEHDLDAEMRRIADSLDIEVAAEQWPALTRAATFDAMRARPEQLAPDPVGVFVDRAAFFRRGASGAARDVLSKAELARYEQRASQLSEAGLLAWLHGRR